MPYRPKKRNVKRPLRRKQPKLASKTATAVKAIVKSQMNKVIETKRNDYLFEPLALNCFYHNVWYVFENDCFFLNQGVQDSQSAVVPNNRIGDSIYAKNINYSILFTSFVDRPNICLRIVILKVKQFAGAGLIPTSQNQLTNNVVQSIDAENSNIIACKYDKTFVLNRNVNTTQATRDTKFLWQHRLPINHRMKYADGAVQPSNFTYRIYAMMYDTQGSLQTDNVGRFSYRRSLYFQDA
jgi:hypothetical protein